MITQVPSSFANAVAPFAPLGRQAVGQEGVELKDSTLKALEQPSESGHTNNRRAPDEHPNNVAEQARVRDGRPQRQQTDEQASDLQQRQQEAEHEAIRELAARDREVRAHEQAHAAVGGRYAGSPVYEYKRGPDGVSYAVGGEVPISTGPVAGDPEATIAKAQQIRRAASAPADPSPQDRQVAAEASRLEAEARAELQTQQTLERDQAAKKIEREQELQTRAENEKRAREERRTEESQQAEQARTNRARFMSEGRSRNIDLNRRLLDIGVLNTAPAVGRLLNNNV